MWSIFIFTLARAANLSDRFPKTEATLGDRALEVYVADTDERRGRGLMYVDTLPRDQGMLFVFPAPQTLGFWMKNTRIPLAIGFFDERCELREVLEMAVPPTALGPPGSYASARPMQFALEMNTGWYGTKPRLGERLKVPKSFKKVPELAKCR